MTYGLGDNLHITPNGLSPKNFTPGSGRDRVVDLWTFFTLKSPGSGRFSIFGHKIEGPLILLLLTIQLLVVD